MIELRQGLGVPSEAKQGLGAEHGGLGGQHRARETLGVVFQHAERGPGIVLLAQRLQDVAQQGLFDRDGRGRRRSHGDFGRWAWKGERGRCG